MFAHIALSDGITPVPRSGIWRGLRRSRSTARFTGTRGAAAISARLPVIAASAMILTLILRHR